MWSKHSSPTRSPTSPKLSFFPLMIAETRVPYLIAVPQIRQLPSLQCFSAGAGLSSKPISKVCALPMPAFAIRPFQRCSIGSTALAGCLSAHSATFFMLLPSGILVFQ